jgi:uncharacterized protein (UPF0332 family)
MTSATMSEMSDLGAPFGHRQGRGKCRECRQRVRQWALQCLCGRCYYSCFQAAIAALLRSGIRPRGRDADWGHGFVQAQFAGVLVGRRKQYGATLRDILPRLLELRERADYEAT